MEKLYTRAKNHPCDFVNDGKSQGKRVGVDGGNLSKQNQVNSSQVLSQLQRSVAKVSLRKMSGQR